MPPIASKLRSDLENLTERLVDLIGDLPINRLERDGGGVVVIAPEFYWGSATAEQLRIQLAIKRDYEVWIELLQSVFSKATDDLTRTIEDADSGLRSWIELSSNWSISSDRARNEEELRADARRFSDLLAILDTNEPAETILIPDTNAIVSEPDPNQYNVIAKNKNFVFLLLPTVLAELDALKISHIDPQFRSKVSRAIKRIKGWRNQGNLLDGVTVNKTITVRAVATEPNMANALSWLDKDNRDDRIIATVIEVQAADPTSPTTLVTGDINLSNKADLARIETADLSTI